MKFSTRQRLMASTLLFGAAGLASPAWAQQGTDTTAETPVSSEADPNAAQSDPGSPAADEPAQGDAVIVTGSRILRRDLTSTSPLAVVQDEEFQLSGSVNVESVLNTLPQVIPGATAFSNNPGGGIATLNLRGLGAARNLVLVNGRRYIFFDTTQITDLNTIPSFLVDSVDVVTGGASAVYGSDALAGVTNFHLRSDLNGIIAGGQYSLTEEGDGARYNIYSAIGTEFGDGRGNVTIYGEYYNRRDIFQDARDFSAFALGDGATSLIPLGSGGVPEGRHTSPASVNVGTVDLNGDGDMTDPGEFTTFQIASGTNYNATNGGAFFDTPGTSIPYCGGPCSYNYAPSNYLMVPQKRWSLGGYGEYEIIDGVNAYAEVSFVNNQVDNELAATPITQNVNINLADVCAAVSIADCNTLTAIAANQQAANAFATLNGRPLPFGQVSAGTGTVAAPTAAQVRIQANYRVTQIANRLSQDDRNAYRMLGGFRGGITDDINYDVYYMYSRTKNANIQLGNVSRSAFAREVTNVFDREPTAADDTACNIFGANQLSPACIAALSVDAQNQEESRLQVAQASISGSAPFTFPWARDAVGFAVGTEWRSMDARFIPDTALSSGDVAGFNAGDPTSGQYDVKELFGEIRLPIIQDNFIHRLELNGAYRYSDYELDAVGGVHTYAVGAEMAPVPDITFRGQYQRAVRAPNVGELFGGQAVGFPLATDPCATVSAINDPVIRQVCIDTGVPAGVLAFGPDGPDADLLPDPLNRALQPNAQIEGFFGGNVALQEEVGDTYTVGAIIRPRWVPRLNIAIDWYDIKVANAISAAGGGVGGILDLCYNVVQNASSPICALINRDPSGSISGGGEFVVTALNANLSGLRTKGVDWQLDYSHPINFGLMGPSSRLSFFVLGNYQYENSFTRAPGDPGIECAGKFGALCGDPTPKWKWTSRLSWADGPLTTSIRWRHLNSVKDDDDATDYIVEKIDSYDLFDLALSFDVTDNATLNFGINNLFDKKPPLVGDQQEQANTFPGTYDVLGRDYFVSAQFRL